MYVCRNSMKATGVNVFCVYVYSTYLYLYVYLYRESVKILPVPHLCRKKRTTGTSFLAFSAHLKAILGVPGYGTQIMYNVQKLKFTDQSRLSVAYCRAVATGTRPVYLSVLKSHRTSFRASPVGYN
jgi:hypothetical protein